MVRFDSERQKLLSAVQSCRDALVADVDGAVDDDVVRREAEPRDARVVADLEVEGFARLPYVPGLNSSA